MSIFSPLICVFIPIQSSYHGVHVGLFGWQTLCYGQLCHSQTINTEIMTNNTPELRKIKSLTKCRSLGHLHFVRKSDITTWHNLEHRKRSCHEPEPKSADQQQQKIQAERLFTREEQHENIELGMQIYQNSIGNGLHLWAACG